MRQDKSSNHSREVSQSTSRQEEEGKRGGSRKRKSFGSPVAVRKSVEGRRGEGVLREREY